MAGSKDSKFVEKLTPYLQQKLVETSKKYGIDSNEYKAFERQYLKSKDEDEINHEDRLRHYQSEVHVHYEGKPLRGVERLYRRTILLEPTMVCAAHCRWCLRGQYPQFGLTEDEITNFAKYTGSDEVKNDLKEILITGGDPFMVPKRLEFIFSQINKFAPNIEIIRIGTRVPVQDPSRVNNELISILKSADPIRLEIGTNINHPSELTIESRKAYTDIYKTAFKIYDQTVLLKGVNDNVEVLNELYDAFRYLGIESHYLFHCIPMQGMEHHRTSVQKGLEIASQVTNSGGVSGRALRYRKNHEILVDGMKDIGFELYLQPANRSYIITSFISPNHLNFDFCSFYQHLSNRGYLIYPGKVSNANCFRIGSIGYLFKSDIHALLSAVQDTLTEMQIDLSGI